MPFTEILVSKKKDPANRVGPGLHVSKSKSLFLLDKDLTSTEMGRGLIQKDLEEKLKRNDVTKFTKETILANIKTLSNISDLAQCEVIIETIDENLELKKDLYAKIEEVIPKETILITNTSSFSLQSLSENIHMVIASSVFTSSPL